MPAEIASCGRGCLSCAHVEMGGAAYVHVVSPLAASTQQSKWNQWNSIHTHSTQPANQGNYNTYIHTQLECNYTLHIPSTMSQHSACIGSASKLCSCSHCMCWRGCQPASVWEELHGPHALIPCHYSFYCYLLVQSSMCTLHAYYIFE